MKQNLGSVSFVSHHDPSFKNLERTSCLWLEDEMNNGLSVGGVVVLEKALQLHNNSAEDGQE